ncbi:hypothetical protein BDR07DRAFT_1548494 [Suillus spraguei]|nr:hypothetical protein BDR07DRAFT_1548494 [Suillus spraguei]
MRPNWLSTVGGRKTDVAVAQPKKLLEQVVDLVSSNSNRAEELYKQILDSTASTSNGSSVSADKEQCLRDQESALIKLAELYQDQRRVLQSLLFYASPHSRQRCQWLSAQVIILSRSLMPSTARAKSAKLKPKRLDDKVILIEVLLLESRVIYIGNLSKSKSGALLETYFQLAEIILHTIKIDVYCRKLHYLDAATRLVGVKLYGHYNIDHEAGEPNPYVVDLNTESSNCNEFVSAAMLKEVHRVYGITNYTGDSLCQVTENSLTTC